MEHKVGNSRAADVSGGGTWRLGRMARWRDT